jgi:DNA helicase-2/ATP-dependent DNA helicase PcrA
MNETTLLENIIKDFNLSKKQKDIVEAIEDNILVIACPGSGKTHTLIARYINMLLKYNLKPEETIMITFTKKAGVEMLNRINKIIPNRIPYHVGTIHGLSYKILKEYNNLKNIVMDEQDSKELLDDIINHQKLENHEIIKPRIQNIIDQASITFPFDMKSVLLKNNLEQYSKEFNLVYKLYKLRKKKDNLIDFNDLMIMLSNFLLDNKTEFKNKIKYIFFDEYQDVNSIQNNILLKLSENSKVMVVGDDAQSIYSFRGSSVKYILNYDLGKPHKMYLLEENYRSSQPIVEFCQDIISHNLNQFNKNIISMNNDIKKPDIYSFKTVKEQYEWVSNDILKKIKEGVKLSEIAILSRKNNLLNEIELYLVTKNILVSKNLGLSLLNKPHIKDFIAFIIITQKDFKNIECSIYWKRIIRLHSAENNINKIEDLPELYNLIIQIKKIKKEVDKLKLVTNYLEQFWTSENKKDVNKLLNYLKDFSLQEFINNIYLNQEVENNIEDTLYLSTIHGSKGLEWEYVYIIDMNSKHFSFIRPKYYLDELEEIDEERRLFYVASSRAKKGLSITFNNLMSSLLREINFSLYNYSEKNLINKINPTLNISIDIKNHLSLIGYFDISKSLSHIMNNKSIIHKKIDISEKIDMKKIICLLFKIIETKYNDKIKNKISYDLNLEDVKYNDILEKGICKIINMIKPKEIFINYNISYGGVVGNIDILCDHFIIVIGTRIECNNICEKLLHTYLLKKNNNIITNIIFYNPLNGEINNLNIEKINIINFKKIIY